jgi:hypothetical protein
MDPYFLGRSRMASPEGKKTNTVPTIQSIRWQYLLQGRRGRGRWQQFRIETVEKVLLKLRICNVISLKILFSMHLNLLLLSDKGGFSRAKGRRRTKFNRN